MKKSSLAALAMIGGITGAMIGANIPTAAPQSVEVQQTPSEKPPNNAYQEQAERIMFDYKGVYALSDKNDNRLFAHHFKPLNQRQKRRNAHRSKVFKTHPKRA